MSQKVNTIGGVPLPTVGPLTKVDDTAAGLPTSALYRSATSPLKVAYCVISVETNPIRFSLDATPVAGTKGKQVEPGQDIILNNEAQIKLFKWCNGIAGKNATIFVYPEEIT